MWLCRNKKEKKNMLISDSTLSISSTYRRPYISSDNLHWVENVVVGKHCFLVPWRIWFLGALKILSSWALPSKTPRGRPVSQNIWNIKTVAYIFTVVGYVVPEMYFDVIFPFRIEFLRNLYAKFHSQKLKKSITAALWILGDLEFVNIYMCLVSVVSSPGWSFSVSQTFLQIPLGKVRTRIMERAALGYPERLVSWLYFLKGVEFSWSS